jgi:hypothetical protein
VIAALIHTETRLTRDGELVRSLVDRCTSKGLLGATVALLAVATSLLASVAFAQKEPEVIVFEDEVLECDATCRQARDSDAEVLSLVDTIFEDRRFREFPHEGWSPLGDESLHVSSLIERFLRWLEDLEGDAPASGSGSSPLSLPGPVMFAVLMAILMAFVVVSVWLNRPKPALVGAVKEASEADPLQKDVETHLHDAERLAHEDLRSALRALYLAALVGMSRGGFITIMAERTNGQYLRELKSWEMKRAFSALTCTFERVFYGREEPTRADYEQCLGLVHVLRKGGTP